MCNIEDEVSDDWINDENILTSTQVADKPEISMEAFMTEYKNDQNLVSMMEQTFEVCGEILNQRSS